MVRVGAGSLRGRVLATPADERVRPTTGRMREALFSMLGERLAGAWVLDLYAGSGILGIESISRGARGAWFVEADPGVAAAIRGNLSACGVEARTGLVESLVLQSGLAGLLRGRAEARFGLFSPFDLILMDPPYRRGLVPPTMEMLAASALLAPGALAVAEHEPGAVAKGVAPDWRPMHNRRHGETQVSFWQWRG
ncbi:MAG: 16S rRNA (guanine(966)-N(2))-methyltransferase RsmD [Magnetococcales bacterium]|nr:16S rRNA (guanine(966)-N(2))-methyltransferase RsmD [Magnetococcales bacterium]